MDGLEWNPISDQDREELEALFTLEEIRYVVFGFDSVNVKLIIIVKVKEHVVFKQI